MGIKDVLKFKSTLFLLNQDFISARFVVRSTRMEKRTEKRLEAEILEEGEVQRLRTENQKRISDTSRLLGKVDVADAHSLKEGIATLRKTFQLEKMTVTELKKYSRNLHKQVRLIAKIIENLHQLVLREDLEVVHDTRAPLNAVDHFAHQLKKVVPKLLRQKLSPEVEKKVREIVKGIGEELEKLVGEVLSFTKNNLSFYQSKSTKRTLAQHLRERTTFKRKINGKVQWVLIQIKDLENRLRKELNSKETKSLQQALLNELAYFSKQFEELIKFSILRVQIAEFMIIEAMKKEKELTHELMGIKEEATKFFTKLNMQRMKLVVRGKQQHKKEWYQSRAWAFSEQKQAIDATVKALDKKVSLEENRFGVTLELTRRNLVAELNTELKKEDKIRLQEVKAAKQTAGNVGTLMRRGTQVLVAGMLMTLGANALNNGLPRMSVQAVEEKAIEQTMSSEDIERLRRTPKLAAEFAEKIGTIIEDKSVQTVDAVETLAVKVARGIKTELAEAKKQEEAAKKKVVETKKEEAKKAEKVKVARPKKKEEKKENARRKLAGAGKGQGSRGIDTNVPKTPIDKEVGFAKLLFNGAGFELDQNGNTYYFKFTRKNVAIDLASYTELIQLKAEALEHTSFRKLEMTVHENLIVKSLSENAVLKVTVDKQRLTFECFDVILIDGPTTLIVNAGKDIKVKSTGRPDLDYAGDDLVKEVLSVNLAGKKVDQVTLVDDNYFPDVPIMGKYLGKSFITEKDFLDVLNSMLKYPVYWGAPGINDSDHYNIVCNGLMRSMFLAMLGNQFIVHAQKNGLGKPIDMRRNTKWKKYFSKVGVTENIFSKNKLKKIVDVDGKLLIKSGLNKKQKKQSKRVGKLEFTKFGEYLKIIGVKPMPGMVIMLAHKGTGGTLRHAVIIGEVDGYNIKNVYAASSKEFKKIGGERGSGMAQVKKRTLDIYDGYYVEQVIDSYTYLAKMGLGQPQLAYIDSVNKVN